MSTDWEIVEGAFAAASVLKGEEQAAYLEQFEDKHPDLVDRLRELLAADADQSEPLALVAEAMQSLADETGDPWLGREIGPWTLTRRIGEGGMGAVFLARRSDDEYDQLVALKLMTSRMVGRDAIARFRAERQILAQLSHPFIARLLDGGSTQDDQPYIAMEYVDGLPIDQFCDERELDVASRLRLFGKVCDAVDYAHRNLIVHRDLKPSNILVDERGEPKLLDFGIAKLLDAQSMNQTMAMTREGMLVLTPEYASPEQVRGEPPSIATDVYALGVLLYRLLTGQSPYGRSVHSAMELEKAIVSQDPRKPSTVVTAPPDATGGRPVVSAETLSQQRKTSPDRLRKRLLGDLDNIVLRALQKDRSRRYATASGLKVDIGNYLANRPVEARPDSFSYRSGKFLRRNWLPVAGVSVFVLTVAGLVSFYTAQLTEERDAARLEAARAEQVSDFLTGLFEEASPSKNFGKPKNASELLDSGADKIAGELGDQPELRAALTLTIADTYVNMRENKAAREFLEPLLGDFAEQLGEQDVRYLSLEQEYGNAVLYTGDRDEAKSIFERNHAAWQKVVEPASFEMGISEQRLGAAYSLLNEPDAAAKHLLAAMEILRRYVDDDPAALTGTMMEYGVVLRSLNRFEEEEAMLHEALAIQADCCGTEQVAYADLVNNLGNNYYARGLHEKAEAQYRKVTGLQKALYGENGVGYANALMNLSNSIMQNGDIESALETQLQGREIYRRGYGEDSVAYAYASENVANYLMELKRYGESETYFLEAMTILESKFGADDAEYAITQSNYGNMLMRAKRNDEGIVQLIAAHDTFLAEYGTDNRSTISSNLKIANALLNMQDVSRAFEYASAAVESASVTWPDPHPVAVAALTTLGRTHRDARRFDTAIERQREAIELAKQLDGEPLRPVILAEYDLAKTLKTAGRMNEARAILEPRLGEIAGLDETWGGIRADIEALLDR